MQAALPAASEASEGISGGTWVWEGISRLLGELFGTGRGTCGAPCTQAPRYLDVLPEKVRIEAEPVGGDVKPSLDEDVPLESTGANCKAEQGQARCQNTSAPRHPPLAALPTFQHALLRRDVLEQLVVLRVVLAGGLQREQSKITR